MKYIFLALFIAFSLVHLYASGKKNKKLRAVTKVFLLPLLLGWYLCSDAQLLAIVIAAIITSWLGDVFLIGGATGFAIGGTSFLASHVCFAVAYCMMVDFAAVPVWAMVLAPAAYVAAVALVFKGMREHIPRKRLYRCMVFYLIINGAMNCFALFRLLCTPCAATVITFVGAVLFFVSDSILFHVRFKKDTVFKTHFLVMLTYILAEFLIVEGFILL